MPASGPADPAGMGSRIKSAVVRLYQPRMLLTLATLAGLAIAAPQVFRLVKQVREQPEYQTASGEIRLTPPPPHVPRSILAAALTRAGLPDPFSRLEPDLAARLHAALEEEPWVETVRGVVVRRDGVELHLDYRTPALVVPTPQGQYLVAADGVLLPPETMDRLDLDALPRLQDEQSAPVAPAGRRWRNETVVTAARLAADLGPLYAKASLGGLSADADRRWTLHTAGGSRIVWGTHQDIATEPTREQKRQRLAELLTVRGPLQPGLRIDLTRWDVIAIDPLPRTRR